MFLCTLNYFLVVEFFKQHIIIHYKWDQANVREIFSDNADLTNMFDENTKGKLSDIIHKAKIIVNEKGTTAAAATGKSNYYIYTEMLQIRKTCDI